MLPILACDNTDMLLHGIRGPSFYMYICCTVNSISLGTNKYIYIFLDLPL